MGRRGKGGKECMALRCSHLGSHGPLALQLCLIPVKGLLSTILQIIAVVVFRKAVLYETKQDTMSGSQREGRRKGPVNHVGMNG
jgi:hypothetical protein